MSDRGIATVLAESTCDVLERMFFLELAPLADAPTPRDPITAEVTFAGDPPGRFSLTMEREAARMAAADFLGADPEEIVSHQQDEVVCELANMICGSVLSQIESDVTFRLEQPVVADAREAVRPPAGATFDASIRGGTLHAEIRMETVECPVTERVF